MCREITFNRLICISAAVTLTMLFSCSGATKKDAFITFYTGTVEIQRSGVPVAVQIKEPIKDGDRISVGDRSCLVLQTSDGVVVRFEEKTDAVISAITNVSKREISISKGKVLSLVGKLKKGDGYTVQTPTTVAAVRGTQFLTEVSGKKSIIAVGDGLVSVQRTTGTPDEKLVEKGSSAVAEDQTTTVVVRGVTTIETLELSKLSQTPVVDNIAEKKPEEIRAQYQKIEQNENKVNETILDETGRPIEELKQKYGRLDVLSLYNGRVVQGVILSRGANFKVLTSSGAVFVDAKDISRTDIK